jgi:predicted aspartyl protease
MLTTRSTRIVTIALVIFGGVAGKSNADSITIDNEFTMRGIFVPTVVVEAGTNSKSLITTFDTGAFSELLLKPATATDLGVTGGAATSTRVGPISTLKTPPKPLKDSQVTPDSNVDKPKLNRALDLTANATGSFDAVSAKYLINADTNGLIAILDPSKNGRKKVEMFAGSTKGIVSNDVTLLPPNSDKIPESTSKLPVTIEMNRPFTPDTETTEGTKSFKQKALWDTGATVNLIGATTARNLGFTGAAAGDVIEIDQVVVPGAGGMNLVLKKVPFTVENDDPLAPMTIGAPVIERFRTVFDLVDSNNKPGDPKRFIGLTELERPTVTERAAPGKVITVRWTFQDETILKQSKTVGASGEAKFSGPFGYTDIRQVTSGTTPTDPGTADLLIAALDTADNGELFFAPFVDRIFDLNAFLGELAVPDLFPGIDLTGDGFITDDDILYSVLADIEDFVATLPSFSFGQTFGIVNGVSSLLPGMLFSTDPFTFDPLLGFTSSSLFTGPGITEAAHFVDLQPVPEPGTFMLLGIGYAAWYWRRRPSSF